MAVAELDQMGAFDRAVLNVATTTGRGWLNENQVQALEYMWSGDTATVAIQYSYLPSWMSYLAAGHRAPEAGTALFEAVHEHWESLPADQRPLLVVSGESLGSFGSESAFRFRSGSCESHRRRIVRGSCRNESQLAVVHCPPRCRFTRPSAGLRRRSGRSLLLRRQRLARRERGREPPHWLPVHDTIHTWLDTSLAFNKPDWLKSGQRGPYIPDQMIWIPGVTLLQVGIDQLYAMEMPGHGHDYGQSPAVAWAHILAPPTGSGRH